MRRDRIPGGVTKLQLRPIENYSIGEAFTSGWEKNRSTSGSFSRLTSFGILLRPIIITSIIWDIKNTGNYTLQWVALPNGTSVLKVFGTLDVGSAGAITFTPPYRPYICEPGAFHLQLTKNDGAATWDDRSVAGFQTSGPIFSYNVYYNATNYAYTAPYRLVGNYLNPYPNSANFIY